MRTGVLGLVKMMPFFNWFFKKERKNNLRYFEYLEFYLLFDSLWQICQTAYLIFINFFSMKKALITLLALVLVAAMSHAQTSKPAYGKKLPNQIKLQEKVSTAQQVAVLREHLQMKTADELRTMDVKTDELGFKHEKFQQFFQGVKVEGANYTIHSQNGTVTLMMGDYFNITDLDVTPSLSEQAAFNAALAHVNARQYAWEASVKAGYPDYAKPSGELVVYPDPERRTAPRLAYKFDIYAADPVYRAYVFIDAHTGAYITEHLRIHESNTPATGTAIYNGSVSFTADYTGSNYRLRQTSSGNGVQTYDMNNGTNYNNAVDFTSNSSNFTSDDVGVQAHWGAEQVHAYYLNEHNRNSYNGSGGILRSYVHYSNNYVNAFWDGTRMTYGDGDGQNYGPLVSLDICGHEITHGVTEYTANLVYQNESGALNESFSDIFGEAIENYATGSNDWLMGDQIGAGGSGGAIRS
ncbi:MAG: peptidase M4 family protein, partial [Bacteroidetes bacterium]